MANILTSALLGAVLFGGITTTAIALDNPNIVRVQAPIYDPNSGQSKLRLSLNDVAIPSGKLYQAFNYDFSDLAKWSGLKTEETAPDIQWASGTALPGGLNLSDNGFLSGVPNSIGMMAIEVIATSEDISTSKMYTITIDGYPPFYAKQLALGESHTCAVTQDNTVKCWGLGWDGQLGNGVPLGSVIPVKVQNLTNVKSVYTGANHSCAITSDGSVSCWGQNTYGKLGLGDSANRLTPTPVPGLSNVVQLGLGKEHSCALIDNGTVQCWGYSWRGALGDGTTTNKSSPVPVLNIDNATALYTGHYHNCALTGSGTKCWGDNFFGQTGSLPGYNRDLVPRLVSILNGARQLALGYGHTCMLNNTGNVSCMGYNVQGNLGDGTTTQTNYLVQALNITDATSIAAGTAHTCAVLSTSEVKCWGENLYGQLGDGSKTNRSSPVLVQSGGATSSVFAQYRHTCGLSNDQTASCWGLNGLGGLGDGTYTQRASPSPVRSE